MNNIKNYLNSQVEKENLWGSRGLIFDVDKDTDTLNKQTQTEKDSEASEELTEEEWEKKNLRYGWGSFKPDCIQCFNSIRWFVFFTCVFSLFQGYLVNGVINAVLTTIEKRFELPSSRSGLIVSSNDFFAFFLVLLISFYGGKRNKPKLIGIGIVTLGIGAFVFSLPHFFAGQYSVSSDLSVFENVCDVNGTETAPSSSSSIQNYLYVFMLGNALHGAGSTPMFTLGTTYIDLNTKAKMTSLYLGLIYASASIGVAAGYMLGGQTLKIYTNFDQVDPKDLNLSPLDPRWIGAWWINFLIVGSVMIFITIPVLGFPKRLPGSAKLLREREEEAHAAEKRVDSSMPAWKEFPMMIWALICNPTFFFLALATCTEGMVVSGVATFGAKFFQEKFNIPAAFAGFLMGIVTVPGAGGGMFLGGYLVKKFKLKCKGIIRMDLIVGILALVLGCLFFIQCPVQPIAGVTSNYISKSTWEYSRSNLTNKCSAACQCTTQSYEPVCGMDGLIYFSPCYAGCSKDYTWMESPMGMFKAYKQCNCVQESFKAKNDTMQNTYGTTNPPMNLHTTDITKSYDLNFSTPMNTTSMSDAFQGICPNDCKLIWVVVPLMFLGMLFTFTTVSPTQTATLRCVLAEQKSLAIGLQWLFLRLLGTTPGPLILGNIMDSACEVWQDISGQRGNCWIYEKTDMGVRLFAWWCITKALTVLFYFLAQYFYKPPPNKNDDESNNEKKPMTSEEGFSERESVI